LDRDKLDLDVYAATFLQATYVRSHIRLSFFDTVPVQDTDKSKKHGQTVRMSFTTITFWSQWSLTPMDSPLHMTRHAMMMKLELHEMETDTPVMNLSIITQKAHANVCGLRKTDG